MMLMMTTNKVYVGHYLLPTTLGTARNSLPDWRISDLTLISKTFKSSWRHFYLQCTEIGQGIRGHV